MPSKSVWEHVDLVPAEESVLALWGDVTLVFLEVNIYICIYVCVCGDIYGWVLT